MIDVLTNGWIGADWTGPKLSPYAEAVCENYNIQTPWYLNTTVSLGAPPARQTILTAPQQNDVLIVGAHVQGTAGQLPFVYLQVTSMESGIPWALPNILPFVPITALAGVNFNSMPNLKLPEAFFMPARSQLKLDWTVLGQPSIASYDPLTLTLIGIQLINPVGGQSPRNVMVTMPDGTQRQMRIHDRLPLFMTMGVGEKQAGGTFFLTTSQQRIQYLPPIDCDVEIHDLSTNVISAAFAIGVTGASSLQVKLTTMGVEKQWTPNYTPITSLFGGPGGGGGGATQLLPAWPYSLPYRLPKGHRTKISVQNTSITATYTQALLTFRCVRLCEY